MKHIALLGFFFLSSNIAHSWNGYDWESGSYIEIDKGNLVREGRTIEIYDSETSEYKDVDVEHIDQNGNLEIYDPETGEYREFDMD